MPPRRTNYAKLADELERRSRPQPEQLKAFDQRPATYRVYGPDFRIERKEVGPGLSRMPRATTTTQRGWWAQTDSLEGARRLAIEHGDGRYIIVRFRLTVAGSWRREREGGQEIWMVQDGAGYSVRAIT